MSTFRLSKRAGVTLLFCVASPLWAGPLSAQDIEPNFQNRIEALSRSNEIRPFSRRATRVPEPREPHLRLHLPFGTTYDSNAFRSNTDVVGDYDSIFNPYAVYRVPVGSGRDRLDFYGETNFSRYADNPTLDGDHIYTHALYRRYAKRTFRHAATEQYYVFKIANTMSFTRGFGREKNSYLKPSIRIARKDIPLDNSDCGSPGDALPCHFLNVSTTWKRSWAKNSSRTSDRTTGAFAFVVGKRIPSRDLTLELSGSVDGHVYDSGRDDAIFKGGADVYWYVGSFELSAGFSYTRHRSTRSSAEWNGYSVTPKITMTYVFGAPQY